MFPLNTEISLYCWPFRLPVWQWGQWFWPQTHCSSDTNGIWRSMNNSDRSNLCWCYSHFLENGFSGMIWRHQHGGDAVLSLECTWVAGDQGSTARSTWEDGSACVQLPQLLCILLAACLASSTSLLYPSIFNTQYPCRGKWSYGVISELHQTVLHLVRERLLRKNHCYLLDLCFSPQSVS